MLRLNSKTSDVASMQATWKHYMRDNHDCDIQVDTRLRGNKETELSRDWQRET